GDQLRSGKLPKRLRTAFNLEAERQGLIASARKGTRPATVEFHRAGYEANLRFLVKHGLINAGRS
ncbi:MAG: hypothetical protein H0W14_06045, partial [Actinobacteria bacterium]|nr:hypothetical protein [Actinomycetota bacterium]